MFKWLRKKDKKETAEVPEEKKLLGKFKERLSRTREKLKEGLGEVFVIERNVDEKFFEELEEALITADINIDTIKRLLTPLRIRVSQGELLKTSEFKEALKAEMLKILSLEPPAFPPEARPAAIFVVGVNGVGKTTSIAKLGYRLKKSGFSVLFIAADTFRAAAIEQLENWGKRMEIPVIKQKLGADPASVVFEGLKAATSRQIDVALIDTAGRLHTKYNLMEELKKMARVAGKAVEGAPHQNILVIDATTGQNAVSQVKWFKEALPIHTLIVTKMDGTAKGGIVLTLTHLFKIPISFIGLGEKLEDLEPFDPKAFVEAIIP
ncbi:signal recognition particle-docking protein FtsY [Thermodesulfatator autotrophicus]|uniref:Signal recognition particle receptor FtsY n=1 Tax=Thermodesulfatator autotrophicus TaxID=1795632 RepID=A0A177E6F8_9BACT|nr:signal recognition particle-docking protein FtsY [Thermodesulfatator autotrophicus]OAG27368.1 cell division protein FtsY [Thermodesulfatator autotrophicus]